MKAAAAVGAKPCNFVNVGFEAHPMWLAGEVAGGKNDMCYAGGRYILKTAWVSVARGAVAACCHCWEFLAGASSA